MSLNPLAPVTDYQSMLNRIFWFTSGAALVAVWLLRLRYQPLDAALRQIDFTVQLGDDKLLPMPGGYLLPALAVGIAARVYRLHGRISDWLAVRESFDVDSIIRPMADQLDVDLTHLTDDELARHRHAIMRTAFYPYVGGREPQIDAALVHQALDAWSWFWIGIEATCILTLAGFALISVGAYATGFQTVTATLLAAAIALPTLRRQCRRYALAQVRAILAHPTRRATAQTAFAPCTAHQSTHRHAA